MYQEPVGKEPRFYPEAGELPTRFCKAFGTLDKITQWWAMLQDRKRKIFHPFGDRGRGVRFAKLIRVWLPSCGLTGPLSHQLSQALEGVQGWQAAWLSWKVLVLSLVDLSKAESLGAPRNGMGLWSSGGPGPCLPCCQLAGYVFIHSLICSLIHLPWVGH